MSRTTDASCKSIPPYSFWPCSTKEMKALTIAFNAGWNLSTWVYHYSNRWKPWAYRSTGLFFCVYPHPPMTARFRFNLRSRCRVPPVSGLKTSGWRSGDQDLVFVIPHLFDCSKPVVFCPNVYSPQALAFFKPKWKAFTLSLHLCYKNISVALAPLLFNRLYNQYNLSLSTNRYFDQCHQQECVQFKHHKTDANWCFSGSCPFQIIQSWFHFPHEKSGFRN